MITHKIKRILNISALTLLLFYLTGIILMFITFRIIRFDDDFEFAFSINYLLWGGVSLLIIVLVLMILKTVITRE
jgi:hypothetical protein